MFFITEPGYGWDDLGQLPRALYHGLAGDMAMAGYLSVVPGICACVRIWVDRKWLKQLMTGYMWFVAVTVAAAYTLDAVLFPYWGYRLDATPLFYLATSPGAAMASLPWWVELLIVGLIGLLAWGIEKIISLLWNLDGLKLPSIKHTGHRTRIIATVTVALLTASLFIPVRGGFSEATMTPGRGFYCNDMRLNHLTVNPLFSFLYSVTHWDDLGSQFRIFESDKEARQVLDGFERQVTCPAAVPQRPLLSTARPDVYIIILESFSAHLLPALGGERVAAGLDSYASEGLLFTDFYAESFRTDRGIPAILSGYPAQPTTSAMRYTAKLGNLPSVAKVLKGKGWHTRYYYGGDADFTNMRAYLLAGGYDRVVSEDDFPAAKRTSKWGVHDGDLFRYVLDHPVSSPGLTVIQTSSSHEPFDVPYTGGNGDKRLNAFAYTDKELTAFLDALKASGRWDNSLVIITPDHWGCWPDGLTDFAARHHTFLIMTGGALGGATGKIAVTGSQKDIAPTLMGLLGIETSVFNLGHDLFDVNAPHYAWITEPDWIGIVSNGSATVVTCDGNRTLQGSAPAADGARAFAQLLYADLNGR